MMNINLNQSYQSMNKFERAAVNFLWCERHRSLLTKLDVLRAMANCGDGATFTLNQLDMSKAAAAIGRLRTELRGDYCPVTVVGQEQLTITVEVCGDYNYERRRYNMVKKEIEVSRYIYKLNWTAQEVNEFVDFIADKMRVVMP